MIDLGTVRPGSTVRIPFSTFDKDDGSSITMTNFAAADILVYKDGGTTERASTSGFTATTDFDAKTGKHLIVLDLADDTTSGFWAAGSEYLVAVDSVTVDAVTTGGWVARFAIGYPNALLNTTIATLSSQTSFTLTNGPAEDDALNGMWAVIHDVASAVQMAKVLILDYTGSTKTVTLAAGATFTAAAGDNFSLMDLAPLQPATTGRTLVVESDGMAYADAREWLGGTIATPTTTGVPEVDVTHWLGTACATPTVAGVPEVDITYIAGAAVSAGSDDIVRSGTAQAGASGTITLDSGASSTNDLYVGLTVSLTGGTGAGQGSRVITAYNGTTKVATVTPAWVTNPASDTTFTLSSGGNGITLASLADAVWDELRSGHTTTGTFGQGVASVQGNIVGSVAGVADDAITASSFVPGAITATALAADCITAAKIADGAIDAATFAADAITASALAADAVTEIQSGLATAAALATVDTVVDSILVDTAEIGAAGAGLTAVPWNASWDAEVQSEVQDAIEVNHLDHLLAATYDPTAKPGVADALLNELVESDGGVSRFTANALEQAPGGSGSNPFTLATGTVGSTGNTTTTLHLAGLTQGDDELNDYLLVIHDVSTDEYHSRWVLDWVLSTELATVAALPFTPQNATDTYSLLAVRQDVTGGSGLDAAGVRAAIGLASANLDTQLATIDANVDAILVDTGTTLQAELDGIQADTEDIQSRLPAALVSGRMDCSVGAMAANVLTASALAADAVTEIWTTALTESYAADGAAFTAAQALYEICQCVTDFSISGTTLTVKRRDGSTTAATFTLDSATTPTSRTRAS